MPAVAALLDTRAALVTLRRTLAGDSPSVVACRSVGALYRACSSHLLDAVVVGRRKLDDLDLESMRRQYPSIPMVVYGFFRPDDGTMLQRLVEQGGVAALMVEGVDDPMVGTIVRRHSLSRSRA
ncbi:MAG TPA: hypothetical protein VLL51_01125, partial [Gemmatimonadales bacterium]|nr:hypothetical protein [Gemmatimonadales bacterium]